MVSTTGTPVSLKAELWFPIPGQQGHGARIIHVGINRKRTPLGKPQAGHWFNAYYDGQNIYTIDGQSGEILDWPYDYGDISEWCAMV